MRAAADITAGTLVLLYRELKPDTKRRLALGKALAGLDSDARFNVYRNEAGQIVLDPRVSIPAREAWLFRRPRGAGRRPARASRGRAGEDEVSRLVFEARQGQMNRELRFTTSAEAALRRLEEDADGVGLLRQVRKTLGLLETDIRHPSLGTQEFQSLGGPNGAKVFEAHVQNRTPAAWRVLFVYGPDRVEKGRRVPVLTIGALTSHP